ncbi:MAG: SPASM domain-containing protein, partial [Phenylobacterium sp.]
QGHCVGSYFAIDPDGTITHCDKFDGDGAYALGKVDQPFDDVAQGRTATELRRQALSAKQAKADCAWHGRCRGWCPHEDYVARRLGGPQGCCGLAPLFEGLNDLETPRETVSMQGRPVGRLVSH